MRAQPYMPIEKLMIGIDGECTIPTNCGVVLSQAQELTRIVDAFFDANTAGMKQHGVTWTQLFLTSKGGFGIEPIIYWRDRPNPLRLSKVAEARRSHFESLNENLPAREYAVDLRRRLVAEVDRLHPYHFQIGKYYDYRAAVASPAAWRLLEDFKSNIDPDGFMNPGALGL
jgi:D-lactate dehydrogenase (cytochrome)